MPGPYRIRAGDRCAAGHAPPGLAAGVDRHGQIEDDVVRGRQLRLEVGEQVSRARSGGEQPLLHLGDRLESDELLLDLSREAPAPEVPTVELLQEARRAPLAE